MVKFLHGAQLHDAIKRIAGEPGARCAVAFWGSGSKDFISEDARIICNLKMGGSNPHELKKIQAKLPPGSVRQSDSLHAKVYLGRDQAVVTSANASANGLGLEGVEEAKWLEAGILVSDVADIEIWLDDLWEQARDISVTDWRKAEKEWEMRQMRKPTLNSFHEYNIAQNRLPMPLELAHEGFNNNDSVMSNDIKSDLIDISHFIDHKSEKQYMENRWYLYWERRQDSLPKKRQSLEWRFMSSEVLPSACRWDSDGEGPYRDVLLPERTQPPIPFDANEPNFKKAFLEVMAQDSFAYLREDTDDPWYRKAEKLLPRFWAAVKERYEAERKS